MNRNRYRADPISIFMRATRVALWQTSPLLKVRARLTADKRQL